MTRQEVLDEVNVIYERISNNENNLFSDGKYTEALEILIDYYEVGFIAELEKIKVNFEELANDEWNKQVGADKGLECAIEVIEDRISELKGETDKEYEAKVITRGNCMICGKELTEGLFLCKECENKANSGK